MLSEITKQYLIVDFSNLMTLSQTDIYFKYKEIGTTNVQSKLVHGRKSIDLTDCRVVLNIINASGDMIVDVPNIIDAKNGIIEINFSTASLSKGISFFELTIIESNSATKKSPRISYRVLDSLDEDAVIESDRYPILINLIKDVDDLLVATNELADKTFELNQEVVRLNEAMNEAENVRNTNENTRKSNEVERVLAENNRTAKMIENQTKFDGYETTMNTKIEEIDIAISSANKKVDDKLVECETRMDSIETDFDTMIESGDIANKSYVDAKVGEQEHQNKDILDGITINKIGEWDNKENKGHNHHVAQIYMENGDSLDKVLLDLIDRITKLEGDETTPPTEGV